MTKGNQGIRSKNVVQKPVRTGAGNLGVSVGAVGQLGHKQGSHTTEGRETSYRGENRGHIHQGSALRPALMGNEKALDVKGGGPGTGRTIYSSGSQDCHGNVNPGNPRPTTNRMLEDFGPEMSRADKMK